MELRRALDSFYYSTALCDLRLMNRQFIDENITYNSLLYLELIYAMDGRADGVQDRGDAVCIKTSSNAKDQ